MATVLFSAAACGDDDSRTGGADAATPDTSTDAAIDLCLNVDCKPLQDQCNIATCNPATGACEVSPAADGTMCNDGNNCTENDVCTQGACAGGPLDCSAFEDDCNSAACNAGTGTCVRTAINDEMACDDGNLCTAPGMCAAGICEDQTPTDCSASDDQCNVGMCDPMTGNCMPVPVMDGISCDDGQFCTEMDACSGGTCGGVDFCMGLLYVSDFEADDGSMVADPGSSWQWGAPAGTFINAAAGGNNAWVTNLAGTPSGSGVQALTSPRMDFSMLTSDPIIRFNHIYELDGFGDGVYLETSIDGGMTWVRVGSTTSGINWYTDSFENWWGDVNSGPPGEWIRAQHLLTGTAGEASVQFRFVFEPDGFIFEEGFAIDDLVVLPTADNDLEAVDFILPAGGCGSTMGPVQMNVVNLGAAPVTGFSVSYTVGGGMTVTETVSGTIAGFANYTHTFTTPVNLTSTMPITGMVTIAGDPDTTNNGTSSTIDVIPVVALGTGTSVDFEADDGGFSVEGINASWQWGVPTGLIIRSAGAGMRAWATNLAGTYNNDELSYLVSPCYDFTGTTMDPTLSFLHQYDTEEDFDSTWVEISLNGGSTWTKLGAAAGATNWYSNTIDEIWEGQVTTWRTASNRLTGSSNQSAVRIRFVFESDGSVTDEGVGIDNFAIAP